MISIYKLLADYEQDIHKAVNNYANKVKEIDNFFSSKRKKTQKKITATRERYKKAKFKLSVIEKKLKKSRSKSLEQSHMNAQKKLCQVSAILENLILEIEDIKIQQKIVKDSKTKSARINKSIKMSLMK